MAELELVTLAIHAMGTRFELALWGESVVHLTAAGEEALAEIERLEAQLSLYRTDSDISDLNARAAYEAVPVEPRLFRLLEHAARLTEETEGAFDITIAPLIACWGFLGGTGELPTPEAIAEARELVGMEKVTLDAENYTVRFQREGMRLDLGSIGKGYAIDCAAELLQDTGITSGLLHGGTSSVAAIGSPPDEEAWTIAIQRPFDTTEGNYLTKISLKDTTLSVSAPHGKSFEAGGRRYGHVLDPRTGYPTSRSLLAAIVVESATEGDALSTGLLTLGADWLPALAKNRPDCRALLASDGESGELIVLERGMSVSETTPRASA